MIEEILPNLFRMEIPLPDNPLRSINAYAIKAARRSLIVDTGLRRDECREALRECVQRVGIRVGEADVFLTHMHIDHSGLAKDIGGRESRVFMGAADAEFIETWGGWDSALPLAGLHGFPLPELEVEVRTNPAMEFDREWFPEFQRAGDGDVLDVGEYRFTCVATPGHTAGHLCLHEPERKILLAGDHVLGEISPNITGWSSERNPLKAYLASLDEVCRLPVDRVLPGHRRVFTHLAERVEELKIHHQERLEEVLEIVTRGERVAYDVAAEMTWDFRCESWLDWPLAQRWFATGEALSHLRYLEAEGIVGSEPVGEHQVYFRTGSTR